MVFRNQFYTLEGLGREAHFLVSTVARSEISKRFFENKGLAISEGRQGSRLFDFFINLSGIRTVQGPHGQARVDNGITVCLVANDTPRVPDT